MIFWVCVRVFVRLMLVEGEFFVVRGLLIVVLVFGFGKIILIFVLLWVFKNVGLKVILVKFGLDYIDLKFYEVVSGLFCVNFDVWVMDFGII